MGLVRRKRSGLWGGRSRGLNFDEQDSEGESGNGLRVGRSEMCRARASAQRR
jgi:hypothetical protein